MAAMMMLTTMTTMVAMAAMMTTTTAMTITMMTLFSSQPASYHSFEHVLDEARTIRMGRHGRVRIHVRCPREQHS